MEHRADVSAKRNDGDSPLHRACGSDDVVTDGVLVELGADGNVKGNIRMRAFARIACLPGDVDIARVLVELGADVNQGGRGGYTPLHHAQECGHADIVRLLQKHGACV